MITSNTSSLRRTALIALGCALSLAPITALKAADLQPLAVDKAPSLPVTTSCEKKAGVEGAAYVLSLKNVSKDALKVSAKVLLSVASHGMNKTRDVAEQVIAPGKTVTIADLAAQDKVVVTAEGFAPLEVSIP